MRDVNAGSALDLIAFVFLVFQAFNVFPTPRVSWGWLGLALFVLSFLAPVLGRF